MEGGKKGTIDILKTSDAGRMTDLVPIRYGRMLQSPLPSIEGPPEASSSSMLLTMGASSWSYALMP
jgi:hypothetical protein